MRIFIDFFSGANMNGYCVKYLWCLSYAEKRIGRVGLHAAVDNIK